MIATAPPSPKLLALLKRHEGLRLLPYKDTRGIMTIGYGHDLAVPIAAAVAELQLSLDAESIAHQVAGVIGDDCWATLSPARQAALIDMGFMGPAKLARFQKMIAAIRDGRWQDAHDECLNSQWAVEVRQERASRDADMLLSGDWAP